MRIAILRAPRSVSPPRLLLSGWPMRCLFGLALVGGISLVASAANVADGLQKILAVRAEGVGHEAAQLAAEQLSKLEPAALPELLAGFDHAEPLAANWLRGVVDTVAERGLAAGKPLPQDALEKFVMDSKHSAKGRRVAYEWLLAVQPEAEARLWRGFLNDPSLELRRDAVDKLVQTATALLEGDAAKKAEGLKELQASFEAARDQDQVESIAAQLDKLGVKVDVAQHFGFIRKWKLVGPFDNRKGIGFAQAYPPETLQDGQAEFTGKSGKVAWFEHETKSPLGEVDLNATTVKDKGAVCYAFAEFVVDQEQPVEIRLGSIGGSKVWVNGELLMANEVYHSGMQVDQYRAQCVLKPGVNKILCKLCQNEQTEPWAQRWDFQLRVCDELGTAILSK